MYTGRYTAKERKFIKAAECVSVQTVNLYPGIQFICIDEGYDFARPLSDDEALEFARNDGFDTLEDFWQWFTTTQTLKLIHWTDKRY